MPSYARTALRVVVGSGFAGAAVGVLWFWVSPLPALRADAGGAVLLDSVSEAEVAADGWFAVLGALAGGALALLVAVRARDARLWGLVGLTVGGVLGSLVAWRLGQALGPAEVGEQLAGLAEGARFDGPLRLSALGVLLVWPIATVIVYFAAVAGIDFSDEAHGHATAGTRPAPDRDELDRDELDRVDG